MECLEKLCIIGLEDGKMTHYMIPTTQVFIEIFIVYLQTNRKKALLNTLILILYKRVSIDNAFNEIYPDLKKAPRFECNPGFISDFKNRNNISSRLAHFRQRPLNKKEADIKKEIQKF